MSELNRGAAEAKAAGVGQGGPCGDVQLIARVDAWTGRILAAPGMERLLDVADGTMSGRDLLDVVHPSSIPTVVSTLTVLVDQPGTTRALRLGLCDAGGEVAEIAVLATGDDTDGGAPVVTFVRACEEAAWAAPQPDPLGARERLKSELAGALVRGEVPTIVALKIENLDTIEAACGERAFEHLVEQIGLRVAANVDFVRAHALLGASTMCFLLAEPHSSARAPLAIGHLIRDLVSLPVDVGGTELFLFPRLAVGVALGERPEAALRATLRAVERLSGPTTVQVVRQLDSDDAHREFRLRNELRYAIERDELRVLFQPYVDARTGLVAGAEALARWEHPALGRLGPSEFIPLAEETNFIDALGGWMLRAATQWTSQWLRGSAGQGEFVVSVNLSARQLVDSSIIETVGDALATAGLEPGALCCEITETAMLADDPVVDRMLRGLVDLGVRIAIDDFGTGHATLDYLHRVPASMVKIDRQFIAPLPDDPQAVELVRGTIELVHAMGKVVVAEGVESADQAQILRSLNCDFLQGYLVSRPLDEAHFTSRMMATRGVALLEPSEKAAVPPPGGSPSVVIVDAELTIVGAVRAALEAADLKVAGTATSVSEAVEVVRRVQPDVVLAERQLPDGDTTEQLGRFAAVAPGAAILIFTSKPDERSLSATLAAGGKGYLDKQSTLDELMSAIRQVATGEICIAPSLLRLLTRSHTNPADASLTDRELQVLGRLAQGASTNELAEELFLSVHTVRNHIARVLRKLGARTRLEAVAIAAERDIVNR